MTDLEVGDYVLCRDQYDPNAPLVKQQIVETFAHETDAVRAVSIQDASGNVERLVTTDEHPFWVDRIGWVTAKDLLPGLVVTTAAGGTAVVVENFALLLDAPVMVYNLEVANGHTNFVEDGQGSQTPVWVHNKCALNTVYVSMKKGVIEYVGITNNFARRQGEHLRTAGRHITALLKDLSRKDSRCVEQAMIHLNKLKSNGGTLSNLINSISTKRADYDALLKRGLEILKEAGML